MHFQKCSSVVSTLRLVYARTRGKLEVLPPCIQFSSTRLSLSRRCAALARLFRELHAGPDTFFHFPISKTFGKSRVRRWCSGAKLLLRGKEGSYTPHSRSGVWICQQDGTPTRSWSFQVMQPLSRSCPCPPRERPELSTRVQQTSAASS
jgi:hypothetical protein